MLLRLVSVPKTNDILQVAQLGDRLLNPLHGRRRPRQPPIKGLLCLGLLLFRLHRFRLVHDLRDQRSHS